MNKLKSFTILLGVLLVASFTSCTKEKAGVYSPKKKIQRVYASTNTVNKFLTQVWNWKDNRIESVDYYSVNGGLSYTENFSYEGKRLVRVDDYLNSEYTTYDYDGNNLKSASYFLKSSVQVSTTYTYENKKLSKMTETVFDASKSRGECRLMNSLLPFPTEISEVMSKYAEKAVANNTEKEIVVINWQFTWDGDNITKIVGSAESEVITIAIQYDEKTNPLKGFLTLYSLDLQESYEDGNIIYSKNNATRIMWTETDGDNEIVTFIYQYDKDDYPTMRITRWDEEDFQYSIYYEYQ